MRIFIASILIFMFAVPALAQTTAPSTEPATQPAGKSSDKVSVTHHQITLAGKPLVYTATAGDMVMKDESDKPKADIFFVAYTTDAGKDPATRPITFCFNGGPGAAAVWLHLGAAGPQTLQLDDGDLPVGPPFKLMDNPATWLGASDLVFIDPVSTGYSRPANGESADQFHGVHEDIKSVAEFVRIYLTKYRRWTSPLYLAGESYGTTRAAALVDYLATRYGIAANGVTLVSSVLDFQTLDDEPGNDLPFVVYLPSYAAVAWYHKKLSPALQADLQKTIDQARAFAVDQYAPALAKGASLGAEQRKMIIQQLAAFTGLPADLVDRANLRIEPAKFEKELLGDGRQIIGRFDGRITGYDPDGISNSPSYDPSLSRYLPAYSSCFNDYVRRDLNFESDLPYEVLTDRVQPWSFGKNNDGYLDVIDNLQSAMLQNPHLRVMFVSGYFDLATPFFAADYTIDRLNLSPEIRRQISHIYLPAGHMVYHHRPSAMQLSEEMAKFVALPK